MYGVSIKAALPTMYRIVLGRAAAGVRGRLCCGRLELPVSLRRDIRPQPFISRTSSGTTSTFLSDALGSTIGLVTANNGPTATNYSYQPFDLTTVGGSTNGNSYEFTGRENDGMVLYFYRARYRSGNPGPRRARVELSPRRSHAVRWFSSGCFFNPRSNLFEYGLRNPRA